MAKIASNGGPPAAAKLDVLVGYYKKINDELKARETSIEELKNMKKELAQRLLTALDNNGTTSAKTVQGTVTAMTRHSASLAEPDNFMDFVMSKGLFELMERRANTTACMDYAEENGKLPPGVNITSIRLIKYTPPVA